MTDTNCVNTMRYTFELISSVKGSGKLIIDKFQGGVRDYENYR